MANFKFSKKTFIGFKGGDERSMAIIFALYLNQIVGFCFNYVQDECVAKDIAQESFIKLWQNREEVKTKQGIAAFLYRSAKNDSLNFIRHSKVKTKHLKSQLITLKRDIDIEILDSFKTNDLERKELVKIVTDAIDQLSPRCKEIFILKRLDDKKNRDIATELGITEKAVEANLTRANKRLKELLKHYYIFIPIYFFN